MSLNTDQTQRNPSKIRSFSALDNYALSIIISFIIGSILAGLLIWLHAFGIVFHHGELVGRLTEILLGTLCVSQIVSGMGYISRFFDPLTHHKNILRQIEEIGRKLISSSRYPSQVSSKKEFNLQWFGLSSGLTIGLILSAIELILHVTTPFVGPLGKFLGENLSSFICSSALIIFNASTFGGWGNRTGRILWVHFFC